MTHVLIPRASRVAVVAAAFFAFACSSTSDARITPTTPDTTANPGSPNTQPVVASVTVSVDSSTLAIGHSSVAGAVAKDANGTVIAGRTVAWSSSNSAVATVANGVVSAVATGNVVISAVVDGVTGSASVTVPAPAPAAVATVIVTIDSASLAPGHSAAAHAVAKDAGGAVLAGRDVTWASSNTSVATVAGGVVVGVTAGTASISATVDGVTASASVTVVSVPVTPASVATVIVTIDSASLLVGHSAAVHAVAKDSAGNVLSGRATTWASSNTSVATVTSGVVTGVAAGTATISATVGGVTGTVGVTIAAPPPAAVATVTVTLDSATLLPGSSSGARAVAKDASGSVLTGRTTTWSSGNTAVATVSSSGLVTAVAAGSTAITATVGGVQGTATVTVSTPPPAAVASVGVTLDSASMAVGHTTNARAVAKDAGGNVLTGRTINWSSSNTGVATVNGSGVVTAAAVGTATIKAQIEGVSGTAGLNVTQVPVATVAVTIDSATMTAGHTTTARAVAKDASGNVLTGRAVEWASNNTAAATVNASSGVVTGVAAGTAKITATIGGISNFANVTITAAASGSLANECGSPGAGWIFCDDFDTDRLSKYFEYDNAGGKFVRVASSGAAGSTGMRATYVMGQSNAGHLALGFGKLPSGFRAADAGTANYREMYWRFYMKRDAGWVGDGPDKLTRITIFTSASWTQAMIAHGWTSDSDRRYLMIDPASGTDANGNVTTTKYNDFDHLVWLGGAKSAQPEEDQSHVGVWACYEFHVKLNGAGQSNGLFEMKINGALSAQTTGLNFVSSYNAFGLNAILLENFQNAGAPAANVRTFDNFVVSTQPIGCPAAP